MSSRLGGGSGEPGGSMRATIDRVIRESKLPARVDQVIDAAPVVGSTRSEWLLLGDDGGVTRWNPDTGEAARLATAATPAESGRDPWAGRELRRRLHVSRYGTYAAVVNDYGRHGEVLDLRTGRATFRLDNHGDCAETVPYSFAFAEHRGRTVAIHRTEWNRLDVSAADTGAILTVRATSTAPPSRPAPAHYLDYFHGALYLSPDGARVLDDGWVWHPLGAPTVWRLDDWLTSDVWESEDGAGRFEVCARASYWDQPMTWIDESRVALAGIGDDATNMRQGVRVFDVTRPARSISNSRRRARTVPELSRFEGPSGALFSDGDRLYSASGSGLRIWDPATGDLIGGVPGFTPTHHHSGARELAVISGRTMRRWSTGSACR